MTGAVHPQLINNPLPGRSNSCILRRNAMALLGKPNTDKMEARLDLKGLIAVTESR